MLAVGDRVLVVVSWSEFYGKHGRVARDYYKSPGRYGIVFDDEPNDRYGFDERELRKEETHDQGARVQ